VVHPCSTLVAGSLAAAIALAVPISVADAQVRDGAPVTARNRERSRVVVFRVAPSERGLKQVASALDPLLLAEISKRSNVVAQHALDLPSTQLALDCMAETPDCLQATMHQPGTDAEILIAPTLERSGSELVLSLLYFSALDGEELRHATRREAGAQAQSAIMDAVPSLIAELFAKPEPLAASAPRQVPQVARHDRDSDHVDRSSWPVVPVVLTTAGVALLSAGVAFGLSARATENEYAAARTGSDAEVDAAHDTFERAQTQATIATVGIAAGASAIAAGVALWLFDADDEEKDDEPSARLLPRITRGGAGVVLEARFMEPQP